MEAGRSTWHLPATCSVWGFHQHPGQERCLWYQAENINRWQLRRTDGMKENAVYRVLNTLGSACPERRRRAGPCMQISCQLVRMELTGWGRDVHVHDRKQSFCQAASRVSFPYNFCSCHFVVVFLHVYAVPLRALKGTCLFHMVLHKQVVFILQVNRSNKSLILNGLT